MPQYPRYTTIAIIINYDKRNKSERKELEGNQAKTTQPAAPSQSPKPARTSENKPMINTKVK